MLIYLKTRKIAIRKLPFGKSSGVPWPLSVPSQIAVDNVKLGPLKPKEEHAYVEKEMVEAHIIQEFEKSQQPQSPHQNGAQVTHSVCKETLLLLLLLLLLLSHFSHVRLCVTPQTAAHQAPLSLGSARQEYWSGLPFPSPMHESAK